MRPSYFRPTVIFIVAVVVAIAVYDVWALTHSYDWTISATIVRVSRDWLMIPVVFGVFIGHLFFCQCKLLRATELYAAFTKAWLRVRPTQVIGTDVVDELVKELGLE